MSGVLDSDLLGTIFFYNNKLRFRHLTHNLISLFLNTAIDVKGDIEQRTLFFLTYLCSLFAFLYRPVGKREQKNHNMKFVEKTKKYKIQIEMSIFIIGNSVYNRHWALIILC